MNSKRNFNLKDKHSFDALYRAYIGQNGKSFFTKISECLVGYDIQTYIENQTNKGSLGRSTEIEYDLNNLKIDTHFRTTSEIFFKLLNFQGVLNDCLNNEFDFGFDEIDSDIDISVIDYFYTPLLVQFLSRFKEGGLPDYSPIIILRRLLSSLGATENLIVDCKAFLKSEIDEVALAGEERRYLQNIIKNMKSSPLSNITILKHIEELFYTLKDKRQANYLFALFFSVSIVIRVHDELDSELFNYLIGNVEHILNMQIENMAVEGVIFPIFLYYEALFDLNKSRRMFLEVNTIGKFTEQLELGSFRDTPEFQHFFYTFKNDKKFPDEVLGCYLKWCMDGYHNDDELKYCLYALSRLPDSTPFKQSVLAFTRAWLKVKDSDFTSAKEHIKVAYEHRNDWNIGLFKVEIIGLYLWLHYNDQDISRHNGYAQILLEYILSSDDEIMSGLFEGFDSSLISSIFHYGSSSPNSFSKQNKQNYAPNDFSFLYLIYIIRKYNNFCFDFFEDFEKYIVNPLQDINELLGKYFQIMLCKLQRQFNSSIEDLIYYQGRRKYDFFIELTQEIFSNLTKTEIKKAKPNHTSFSVDQVLSNTEVFINAFIPEKRNPNDYNPLSPHLGRSLAYSEGATIRNIVTFKKLHKDIQQIILDEIKNKLK